MPPRVSELRHSSGVHLKTPLLVPSFSSRGFGKERDGTPTTKAIFQAAREVLADTLLVSAFDLHHDLVPAPGPQVELAFLDSGGYETGPNDDLSAYEDTSRTRGAWNAELHRSVLQGWQPSVPAVFVTFDRYADLQEQVHAGLNQVEEFPHQLHAVLLKPTSPDGPLFDPRSVVTVARELQRFDVIGVTEKELGHSVLGRVIALAKLRRSLDQEGVAKPIHVFGGLDPLSTVLYFEAGAEIFDGLSWLRYGFAGGHALYRENYFALNVPLDSQPAAARAHMLMANLAGIRSLRLDLMEYAHANDPRLLAPHHDLIVQVRRQIELTVGGG